ncbi:hypothetical protein D3C85_1347760 [compost metagenome]
MLQLELRRLGQLKAQEMRHRAGRRRGIHRVAGRLLHPPDVVGQGPDRSRHGAADGQRAGRRDHGCHRHEIGHGVVHQPGVHMRIDAQRRGVGAQQRGAVAALALELGIGHAAAGTGAVVDDGGLALLAPGFGHAAGGHVQRAARRIADKHAPGRAGGLCPGRQGQRRGGQGGQAGGAEAPAREGVHALIRGVMGWAR